MKYVEHTENFNILQTPLPDIVPMDAFLDINVLEKTLEALELEAVPVKAVMLPLLDKVLILVFHLQRLKIYCRF